MMRKFQDLKVWEKAHNLVIEIYKATARFPKQVLQIAFGFVSETEYLLLLSQELGYIDRELNQRLMNQVIDVKRMLTGFIQRLSAES